MSEAHPANQITARHLAITQRLRERRDELGLTQKQIVTRLAKCGLQTTNRALSSLEHGAGLDVGKLPELAAALDCTVTYLLGLTADPHRWPPDEALTLPSAPALPVPAPPPPAGPAPPPAPAPPASASPAAARPGSAPVPQAGSLILGGYVPERRIRRKA